MSLGLIYGFGVGALLGLTGAGGGILAIPALVLGLGFDPRAAVPVALLAVGISALIGAVDGLRRKLVRWRAGLVMGVAGLVATPIGSQVAKELPAHVLMTMFAIVMLYVAGRLLLQRGISNPVASLDGAQAATTVKNCMLNPCSGQFSWTNRCAATLAGIGSACGLMTGMLGVGGGFVIVPAFKQWTNVQLHGIVATSLFVVAIVAMGSAITSLATGSNVEQTGVFFVTASVCGMFAGRYVAPLLSAKTVQTAFAVLAMCVAILLLYRAWFA